MAGRRDSTAAQRRGEEEIDLYASWLEKLKTGSENRITLVQHKHDADMLTGLGVKNVIFYREPEEDFIEEVAGQGKEVILLFDANRPSNELAARVESKLQQRKVSVNPRFRKLLLTSKFKELGGLLSFLHKDVYDTPRKHEGAPEGV